MSGLEPGRVLAGRYEILRKLGEGGMGEVYQARQLNLNRDVAIKTLLPSYSKQPDARARFEREAKVASALKHPNAVEIYDVGEDEGTVFLAMEFLKGSTLHDYVGGGLAALPVADCLAIAGQIAEVLVAAHEVPLVHRDLKPDNIFLEDAPGGGQRVCVVDFGLAFIEGSDDAMGRMTRAGLVVGTPAYLSPEQAQGGAVGFQSDIYSFGAVLYEMVTGLLPFTGTELAVMSQHLYVAPVAPTQRTGDFSIPRELDELVMAMLRKRPEERPRAVEVRDTLAMIEGTLAGKRNRGRDASYLKNRAARMVSVPAASGSKVGPIDLAAFDEAEVFIVGVVGEVEEDVWLGFPSNGMRVVKLPKEIVGSPDDPEPMAIFANTDDLEIVGTLAASGAPVVATVPEGDMSKIAGLLQAGAADVVSHPLSIDNIVRKIHRAHTRAQRKKRT